MRYAAITLLMLTLVSACSTPIKTADIDKVQADCSNVDQTIAMLTKERAENNSRLRSGLQSVIPVSAAVNIIAGNYKQNVSIATGEWAAKIDAKLKELNELKAHCS